MSILEKSLSKDEISEMLVFDPDDTSLVPPLHCGESSSWCISLTASKSSWIMILCLSRLHSLYLDRYTCLSFSTGTREFGKLMLSHVSSLKNLSLIIGLQGLSGRDLPREKLLAWGTEEKMDSISKSA